MSLSKTIKRALGLVAKRPSVEEVTSADYYQRLHENNKAYQENNWLVPELENLLKCDPKHVVEVGCGNARFLKEVSARVERATGLDWAVSPMIGTLPDNVAVLQADITRDDIPSADLICSGDVLEHFQPDMIADVVRRLHDRARYNFHIIACYDDDHSHLTIMPPEKWLALFRSISPEYRLVRTWARRWKKPRDKVCIIANY